LGAGTSLTQRGVGRGHIMAQLEIRGGKNITPFWIMTLM
jgi:hypothetical protein